jgi:glutaredoxin
VSRSDNVSVPVLTLYTRDGCHLCEDALGALERLRPELGFELRCVDIESDEALHRAYLERIPVIALDGEELYDFFLDEADLRRRLAARVSPQ